MSPDLSTMDATAQAELVRVPNADGVHAAAGNPAPGPGGRAFPLLRSLLRRLLAWRGQGPRLPVFLALAVALTSAAAIRTHARAPSRVASASTGSA